MSLIDRARRTVRRTIKQVKQEPKKALDTAKKGYDTFKKVKSAVTDGFDNARSIRSNGFKATWKANADKVVANATNPKTKLNLMGKLGKLGGAIGTVTSAVKLPGQIGTAARDVRNAIRSGSRQDWDQAVGSVAAAGKGAVSTVKGGLEIARDVHKFGSAYRAANSAFRAAVPGAGPKLARSIAGSAAKLAFEGAGRTALRQGVRTAADTAVRHSGTTVRALTGTASRAAARAALNEGGKSAARAAASAAARSAAGPLAKAAGRFAPGANIAIAAFDVASAYSTVRDPQASTGKKVTSVITAIGSVAAATNIPVVSQIGAGVSAVSGFVGSFF